MIALYTTLTVLAHDLRTRMADRVADDSGFSTLEWAVIGSIAFAMAIAVGAGITSVANSYMGKIN